MSHRRWIKSLLILSTPPLRVLLGQLVVVDGYHCFLEFTLQVLSLLDVGGGIDSLGAASFSKFCPPRVQGVWCSLSELAVVVSCGLKTVPAVVANWVRLPVVVGKLSHWFGTFNLHVVLAEELL